MSEELNIEIYASSKNERKQKDEEKQRHFSPILAIHFHQPLNVIFYSLNLYIRTDGLKFTRY